MDIESCFKIGWIVKPHGLKGEVTAMLDDEAPENFSSLESIFIEQNSRLIPYFIQHVSVQGQKAFIKFEGVDTPEQSRKISKQSLYISKSLRRKAAGKDFYADEIMDFAVLDEQRGLLGNITEVIQAGRNPLLVLDYQGKEVLIPVNAPFITNIDKTKKQIIVELPQGFLDL